jgi:late competence protein required for DNA uptake (superfamily II DNA/RNA helicase)
MKRSLNKIQNHANQLNTNQLDIILIQFQKNKNLFYFFFDNFNKILARRKIILKLKILYNKQNYTTLSVIVFIPKIKIIKPLKRILLNHHFNTLGIFSK